MSTPVVDLHCDLLTFLHMKEGRSPFDPLSRSAHPQLKQGGVHVQTLAIFTYPKAGSTHAGAAQIEIFKHLPLAHPDHFAFFTDPAQCTPSTDKVYILPAFENASGFCEEDEPLQKGLARLQYFHEILPRILYISLTWDGENRFGGGIGSNVGLKEDGKQLLRWMDKKKIAVDLSHASDKLAQEILSFIDKNSLQIPVMASHCNFRSIVDMPRNLPNEIAQEIIRRKGLIGLNFFCSFVGKDHPDNIVKHLEHGLKLGGNEALSFGADFFCDADFPSLKKKYGDVPAFFDEYGDASRYPHLFEKFQRHLSLPASQVQEIAAQNFLRFLNRAWK